MDNFLGKLPPLMIGYIMAFPILLATLKLESDRILNIKYEKALFRVMNITFIFLMGIVDMVINDHVLMEYSVMMLPFVYLPTVVLLFLLINNLPMRCEDENNGVPVKKIYGFSRKELAILGTTLLVAIILIILGTIKSSSIVLNHHKQFFEMLSTSEKKEEEIYHETYKSAYSLQLTDDRIDYIKNNPAYISVALPWKMEVTVGTKSDNSSTHWVLTYVKDGRTWMLNDVEMVDKMKKTNLWDGMP